MKKIIIIFTLLIGWFLNSPQILAEGEFEVNYDVYYTLSPNQKVEVIQNISLTNKFSNLYATQYSLILEGLKIENVKAKDEFGDLKPAISSDGNKINISVNFNQAVVGKGKTLNFTISYQALNILEKRGEVWEVNIPRLAKENLMDNYNLYLKVPESFGQPAYIKPQPLEKKIEEGFVVYRFGKEQIIDSFISAAFGDFQVFDFSLKYYLKNKFNQDWLTEIPLPPDTAYQQVFIFSIEPLPKNVYLDNDGNWLAQYLIKEKQELEVNLKGRAKIFSQPKENFPKPSKQNLENNLLPQKYWEADAPLIRQKAEELKNPKAIYDFVVNALSYNQERIDEKTERKGAIWALNNPSQAICTEFTDLFIALARAAGIPAREINGYAYSKEEKIQEISAKRDVLHSWPEYWDEKKQIWIPIDPTWAKTSGGGDYFSKTDLNHLTLVIHGESSEFPYPPGSYKKEIDSLEKYIEIKIGEYSPVSQSKIDVEFIFPSKIYPLVKSKGRIVVKNLGPGAVYNLEVKNQKTNLNLNSFEEKIEVLPPFGNKEFEVEIKPNFFLKNKEEIVIWLNGQKFSKVLKINYLVFYLPIGGIFLILLVFLTKKFLYDKK